LDAVPDWLPATRAAAAAPPADEVRFETPSEAAPVNLTAIFQRIGAHVEDDEEPAKPEPMARTEQPSKNVVTSASGAATSHDDEESIDQYMSRLMERVRATSGGVAPSSPTMPTASPQVEPRETSKADAAQEAESPMFSAAAPAEDANQPMEMTPRTVAPEKNVNLSALRELANLSAQSALGRHSRQVLVHTMYSKLLVAIVALAAGGALLWMWRSLGAMQTTFYAALVALLVAIYWGVEYALLTGRLIISKSGHIDIDWRPAKSESSRRLNVGKVAQVVVDADVVQDTAEGSQSNAHSVRAAETAE
jgi:hypothetical protein